MLLSESQFSWHLFQVAFLDLLGRIRSHHGLPQSLGFPGTDDSVVSHFTCLFPHQTVSSSRARRTSAHPTISPQGPGPNWSMLGPEEAIQQVRERRGGKPQFPRWGIKPNLTSAWEVGASSSGWSLGPTHCLVAYRKLKGRPQPSWTWGSDSALPSKPGPATTGFTSWPTPLSRTYTYSLEGKLWPT